MLNLRLVYIDYYLCLTPIYGLDPIEREIDHLKIERVPVLRLFGPTSDGRKCCVHVHGILPYLAIQAPNEITENILAVSAESSLNLVYKKDKLQRIHSVVSIQGKSMYGYQSKTTKFYKIFLYDPEDSKRLADLLLEGAVLSTIMQPYEVHVPYNLQFLMDYNLRGMDFLTVKKFNLRTVNCDNCKENVCNCDKKKHSTCQLEVDILATEIENRHKLSKTGKNTALENIWLEESLKRNKELIHENTVPSISEEHLETLRVTTTKESLTSLNDFINSIRIESDSFDSQKTIILEENKTPSKLTNKTVIKDLSQTKSPSSSEHVLYNILKRVSSGNINSNITLKSLDEIDIFKLEEMDSILLSTEVNDESDSEMEQDLLPQIDGVNDIHTNCNYPIDLKSLRIKASPSHVSLDLRQHKKGKYLKLRSFLAKRTGSKRDDGIQCEHLQILDDSDDEFIKHLYSEKCFTNKLPCNNNKLAKKKLKRQWSITKHISKDDCCPKKLCSVNINNTNYLSDDGRNIWSKHNHSVLTMNKKIRLNDIEEKLYCLPYQNRKNKALKTLHDFRFFDDLRIVLIPCDNILSKEFYVESSQLELHTSQKLLKNCNNPFKPKLNNGINQMVKSNSVEIQESFKTCEYANSCNDDHITDYLDVGQKLGFLSPQYDSTQKKSPILLSKSPILQVEDKCNNSTYTASKQVNYQAINLSKRINDNSSKPDNGSKHIIDNSVNLNFNDSKVTFALEKPDLLKMAVDAADISSIEDDDDCIITNLTTPTDLYSIPKQQIIKNIYTNQFNGTERRHYENNYQQYQDQPQNYLNNNYFNYNYRHQNSNNIQYAQQYATNMPCTNLQYPSCNYRPPSNTSYNTFSDVQLYSQNQFKNSNMQQYYQNR